MEPLVSIIIPVYNAEKFIKETINSVLNQTYKNIEIILFDDCSSDNTLSIINSFSDKRIKIYKNHINMGVSITLNNCLKVVNGEFIARMDADDICRPDRIRTQMNLFENNTRIDVCGSNIITFGLNKRKSKYPITHEEVFYSSLFGCSMAHPTIMFRKRVLKDFEYSVISKVEDYDLWIKLLSLGYKFHNIRKPLLYYRVHADSLSNLSVISDKKKKLISDYIETIRNANKQLIDVELSCEDIKCMFLGPNMLKETTLNHKLLLESYNNYLSKIDKSKLSKSLYKYLSIKFYEKCVMLSYNGYPMYKDFFRSKFNIYRVSIKKYIILLYIYYKNIKKEKLNEAANR